MTQDDAMDPLDTLLPAPVASAPVMLDSLDGEDGLAGRVAAALGGLGNGETAIDDVRLLGGSSNGTPHARLVRVVIGDESALAEPSVGAVLAVVASLRERLNE